MSQTDDERDRWLEGITSLANQRNKQLGVPPIVLLSRESALDWIAHLLALVVYADEQTKRANDRASQDWRDRLSALATKHDTENPVVFTNDEEALAYMDHALGGLVEARKEGERAVLERVFSELTSQWGKAQDRSATLATRTKQARATLKDSKVQAERNDAEVAMLASLLESDLFGKDQPA